jgi:hypothetical protein
VRGVLPDGFDSTTKSLRTLFPGVHGGTCLRHALLTLPKKLVAIASPGRQALRTQCHTLWYRAHQRRALQAGKWGVEVEGGRVPTSDWMRNLHILTSGGFH